MAYDHTKKIGKSDISAFAKNVKENSYCASVAHVSSPAFLFSPLPDGGSTRNGRVSKPIHFINPSNTSSAS